MAILGRRDRNDAADGDRDTVGRGAGAGVYGLLGFLAAAVDIITGIIAVIIILGILFVVLKANMGNSIVATIHDVAKTLVGPFDGIFKLKDPRLTIAVNWGIALVVYVLVGRLIARLLRRGPG